VAELMGHSGIQITMRYAQFAPQHNCAVVDRPVSVAEARSATTPGMKAANGERLFIQLVTSRKANLTTCPDNRNQSVIGNDLQQVAP